MRLTPDEQQAVRLASREAFPTGTRVLLFGSRVDDQKRGGDIDLLVELPQALSAADMVQRRTRFSARLYRLLGEQRIDVVMTPAAGGDPVSPVVRSARETGVPLALV
ncbi:hypothetical protein C7444_105158 [Sphaerotilus hippei]|uniref:Polymerase nucleotidyl transferase domain-containing protein n=1 Tax=Sphaerotilus hippei TaxID=744406 RepID=A0A318H2N9_9BURK|nr:nucleotidyltransferase domain-containing protein [Sphaerotilus hippei]PXW97059.1 hypothetical protein C7444_105158 [Sphaerotilus hippei]